MGSSGSTAGWDVVIDHDVDVIDCKTGKKRVAGLAEGTVHGEIKEKDLNPDMGQTGVFALCAAPDRDADEDAEHIVHRAKDMSKIVGKEVDVLDGQWKGPNGQDPLAVLFDTTDNNEIADELSALVEALKGCVEDEPSLNHAAVPCKVFGDIHGQFRDVLKFLYHYGWPSESSPNYVFNGDWVDRGHHQIEAVTLVFALKLAYPHKVFLNRGNHEDESQNHHMGKDGFEHAILKRFGAQRGGELFTEFCRTFEYLPLATVVGERVLCVHGGIGDGEWTLDQLAKATRPLNMDDLTKKKNLWLYNLMWSDPIEDEEKERFGVHASPRDGHKNMVKGFGKDITAEFCERNGLGMVVRSHETDVRGCGYEVMHDENLMRVFSARDYGDGKNQNDGSILSITRSHGSLLITAQMLQSLVKKV